MGDPLDEVFAGVDFPGKRPLKRHSEPEVMKPTNEGWDRRPAHKMLKGQLTEFFTIGHLADALGRSTVTIRSWEDKGWLPISKYRTAQPKGEMVPGKTLMGKRLYTRAQVEVVIAAAERYGVMTNKGRDADWKKFAHAVLDGWKTTA